MAELAARREARRRKILGQSENRLKRITGVENRVTKCELDGMQSKSDLEQNETNTEHHNHISEPETVRNDPLLNFEAENTSLSNRWRRPSSTTAMKVIFVENRMKYVSILSLLVSLTVFIFNRSLDMWEVDASTLHLNKIFLPLLSFELYDLIHKNVDSDTPDIFSTLLLMANNRRLNPNVVLFVSRCLRCLTQFVQDTMVYFFVFCMCTYAIQIFII